MGRGGQEMTEGRGIAGGTDQGGQFERPVEPGAESLGQGGVGLMGGPAGRVGAGVGSAQAEAEDRQRQRDHRGQRAQGHGPRASLDEPGPAEPEACGFGAGWPVGGQGPPFPPGQDLGPEEAEHGRQQGERSGHGEGNCEGCGDRQSVEEADAESELAE